MPVAVNCSVSPLATLGLAGVTAIDTSAAVVTVSVSVGLVTFPKVAVMFVVPVASDWARPLPLIVATDGVADAQATWLVRFCVELSV